MANSNWADEAFGKAHPEQPSPLPKAHDELWPDRIAASETYVVAPVLSYEEAVSLLNPAWQACTCCGGFHPKHSEC